MTDRTSHLEQLADYLGILPEYVDQRGERHLTSDDTRRLLLAAMGAHVASEDDARQALEKLVEHEQSRIVDGVRVIEQRDPTVRSIVVRTPQARSGGQWQLVLELEDGYRAESSGTWSSGDPIEPKLPLEPPLGYHKVVMTVRGDGVDRSDEQTLIVVPSHCVTPAELVGPEGAFGVIANLYTVRTASNWGVGDFSDLAALGVWAAGAGADFVGVNPLHALLDSGTDISPYSPVSRRFRNTIYIDVKRVPELELADDVRESLCSPEMLAELQSLRDAPTVPYEQVMHVKGTALDALHDAFVARVRGSGSDRDRAYAEYVALNEPELSRFATWMTLVEERMRDGADAERPSDWRSWSAELGAPESLAVRGFVAAHEARVDFHRWLQFEADRQLGEAAARLRQAGMRVGLYQDLAIGTALCSADVWSQPHLFVRDVAVGAPPDPLAEQGQNWGLPPIDPHALRDDRYRYFIELVRAGFRHAGALRIDHVLGLFRLFWIPNGRSGSEGAYVRYPTADLLGILALESVRHRALVVGEDLGTVPPDTPPTLARWGVLSSKVLQFERSDGGYNASSSYPHLALATANTHDMATIAGFWAGHDLDVRRSVGLIPTDHDLERARSDRANDRRTLLERLAAERILPDAEPPARPAELRAAIHAFLCRTPSVLVGLALDDIAGELESVNVPGVGLDKYPSWSRKMSCTLEEIEASSDSAASLGCDGRSGQRSR